MASHSSLLPAKLRSGYVYNRVLRAIGDSTKDDDRLPDGIPARGTITFSPLDPLHHIAEDNKGSTITVENITCRIHQGENEPPAPNEAIPSDTETEYEAWVDERRTLAGLLVDEAGAVGGVWLPVGRWVARYNFSDRYTSIPPQEFQVTDEHTKQDPLDLALNRGLTPTPGIKFVVNEQVYNDTLAAHDNALEYRNATRQYRDAAQAARTGAEAARDLVLPARDQTLTARDQAVAAADAAAADALIPNLISTGIYEIGA